MDLPKIRDLKDLQAILDLMKRNDLAELELEQEGARIRVRKTEPAGGSDRIVYAGLPTSLQQLPAAAAAEPGDGGAAGESGAESLHVVTSPLVGTFYRAPSPEADPYVQEGDRVDENTVLCLVEAMKVMNEISAGVTGVVREIVVKNAEPVEFGQPLFRIETD